MSAKYLSNHNGCPEELACGNIIKFLRRQVLSTFMTPASTIDPLSEDQPPFSMAGAISVQVKQGEFDEGSILAGQRGKTEGIKISSEVSAD